MPINSCANPLLSTLFDKYFWFSWFLISIFIDKSLTNEIKLILIGSKYKEEIKGTKFKLRFK